MFYWPELQDKILEQYQPRVTCTVVVVSCDMLTTLIVQGRGWSASKGNRHKSPSVRHSALYSPAWLHLRTYNVAPCSRKEQNYCSVLLGKRAVGIVAIKPFLFYSNATLKKGPFIIRSAGYDVEHFRFQPFRPAALYLELQRTTCVMKEYRCCDISCSYREIVEL